MECVDFCAKKIAVVFNEGVKNPYPVLQNLEQILLEKSANPEILEIKEMKYGFDFVFAVGGDGTILHVSKFYAMTKTPVLGINLGRLGYLSQVKSDNIKHAIDNVFENKYSIEKRMMLTSSGKFALNDFVIKGASQTRTSRFVLYINEKFVCDYIADGLIVSTPTGSTAYGLSAGGPVLYPKIDAIEIVPICPHTLTARPLVIPANEKIMVTTSADEEKRFNLITDGADNLEVNSEIVIEKADYNAHLALLEDDAFYSVLRDKLHWGVSPKSLWLVQFM